MVGERRVGETVVASYDTPRAESVGLPLACHSRALPGFASAVTHSPKRRCRSTGANTAKWCVLPEDSGRCLRTSLPTCRSRCVASMAHILQRLTRRHRYRDGFGDLAMKLIATPLIFAAVVLASILQGGTARARTGTTPEEYRARYDARRDVYCIRFFADPVPADPRPGPSSDICQSRAAWAREGLKVDRVPRSRPS